MSRLSCFAGLTIAGTVRGDCLTLRMQPYRVLRPIGAMYETSRLQQRHSLDSLASLLQHHRLPSAPAFIIEIVAEAGQLGASALRCFGVLSVSFWTIPAAAASQNHCCCRSPAQPDSRLRLQLSAMASGHGHAFRTIVAEGNARQHNGDHHGNVINCE